MNNFLRGAWPLCLALALVGALGSGGAGCVSPAKTKAPSLESKRPELWLDVLRSEPVGFDEVLDDLASSRVIYLGEYHSIPRHHELQRALLDGLAQRGVSLVLGMEQFEQTAQPVLDRFNRGELALDGLVESEWTQRWPGHTNYHALLRSAREQGIPVLALNARSETIRAIGRRGLSGIPSEQRQELPREIVTDDPTYERLLNRTLGVHMAFDPQKLRPVFEAQVARDEAMAARLASFLSSSAGRNRTAIVICGRGHCEFGLGMPDRVARRLPGVLQRVVLFSESGDLELSESERRQARAVTISHQFLRDLGRVPADFLHLIGSPSRRE